MKSLSERTVTVPGPNGEEVEVRVANPKFLRARACSVGRPASRVAPPYRPSPLISPARPAPPPSSIHPRSVMSKSHPNYGATVKGLEVYSKRSGSFLSINDGCFTMTEGDKHHKTDAKDFKEKCLSS